MKIDRKYVIDNGYLKAFVFGKETITRYCTTSKWEQTASRLRKLSKIIVKNKKVIQKTPSEIYEIMFLYKILFDFDE